MALRKRLHRLFYVESKKKDTDGDPCITGCAVAYSYTDAVVLVVTAQVDDAEQRADWLRSPFRGWEIQAECIGPMRLVPMVKQ